MHIEQNFHTQLVYMVPIKLLEYLIHRLRLLGQDFQNILHFHPFSNHSKNLFHIQASKNYRLEFRSACNSLNLYQNMIQPQHLSYCKQYHSRSDQLFYHHKTLTCTSRLVVLTKDQLQNMSYPYLSNHFLLVLSFSHILLVNPNSLVFYLKSRFCIHPRKNWLNQ